MMNARLSLLLGLVLTCNACATKIDGLYVSDSFKAAEIKGGPMVTGGVTDVRSGYRRTDSNTYSALLLAEIKDERAYINVKPVETLIQALGEETYDATLQTYTSSGLDEAALSKIASKLPGIRFVALAKVESNVTEKSSAHQAASETKDDKGKVTRNPETTTKKHSRTILATMHVYDLQKKNVAFSGQVTKSKEASQTYTVTSIGNVLSVVNTLNGKDDDATYPTPKAPETREVLSNVFEGFAENFPKAD